MMISRLLTKRTNELMSKRKDVDRDGIEEWIRGRFWMQDTGEDTYLPSLGQKKTHLRKDGVWYQNKLDRQEMSEHKSQNPNVFWIQRR